MKTGMDYVMKLYSDSEKLKKTQRLLRNAEAVLKELARRPENRDQANVYWLAKQTGQKVRTYKGDAKS